MMTGADVLGGIGITSRCADKRDIGNEYLLAKAYADGRPPTIINQPRWNFLLGLCDTYGDDIATNDYSAGEDGGRWIRQNYGGLHYRRLYPNVVLSNTATLNQENPGCNLAGTDCQRWRGYS